MVKLYNNLLVTGISIISVAFSFPALSQSKHASLWSLDNYCLDFNTNPPSYHLSNYYNLEPSTVHNICWYVDSEGFMSVITNYGENKMAVFNKNKNQFEEIETEYQFDAGFFVPKPDNGNQIYYIEQNRYYLIDLQQKTIVLKGDDINIMRTHHIAVHHSDCNKIWIINTDKRVWTTYLLTSSGIEKKKEYCLNEPDYSSFPSDDDENWEINLSKDCQHYTMVNFDQHQKEVYFGDFDRSLGTFMRKKRFNFGNDYVQIDNSIIATDNSRIYYFCTTSTYDAEIIEVPILDGLPDYSKRNKIYSEHKFPGVGYRQFIYGLDDKIYVIDFLYYKISTIEINNKGETVFEDSKYSLAHSRTSVRTNVFLSSWFMDNPCEEKTSPISLPDVCTSQTKTYSVDNPEQGIVYYWEVVGGELSATTGSEVSVKWADTEGNGTLCVYSKHIETGCVSDKNVYSVKRKKSPTAQFDNASVCYGEPLKVMLSGTAPFKVFYTLDGETNSFKTDISEYQMDNIPGNYQLIKVTDGNACETSPTDNNTAIIVSKLQKLIIKELK